MKPIRLMVVDDSALMRKHLTMLFSEEGDFEIKTVRTGLEAVNEIQSFKPDVLTLDINMPEMDGLSALSLIMNERPTPVVMFSSLTEKGALSTLEALALGAVDFIPKPGGTISLSIDTVKKDLINKVRAASSARLAPKFLTKSIRHQVKRTTSDPYLREKTHTRSYDEPKRASTREVIASTVSTSAKSARMRTHGLVVIGVSTGGPRTLENILPPLPADFPWPVMVAQHMPPTFTEAFAKRLDGICNLNVVEVSAPTPVQPGYIYIGKGGTDMIISDRTGQLVALPRPEAPEHLWHPSVEVLMQSANKVIHPAQLIGVMLTGMGYDGSTAMAELKQNGGRTIAESEETATVFGMPAELIKRNGASVVLPNELITDRLIMWIQGGR